MTAMAIALLQIQMIITNVTLAGTANTLVLDELYIKFICKWRRVPRLPVLELQERGQEMGFK
jgi:hypothetical protein